MAARVAQPFRQLDDAQPVEVNRAHDLAFERRKARKNALHRQTVEDILDSTSRYAPFGIAQELERNHVTACAKGTDLTNFVRCDADQPCNLALHRRAAKQRP